ncbi:NAD(P)H-dependent oxidoreductase [Thiomicrolovo sp. ZZH C-3]
MKTRYMEMLHSRHATRRFDEARAIDNTDLVYILEAARLSPSAFGIEPWQFLVIRSEHSKRLLQEAAFGQEQIASASAVVIVLARKDLGIDEGYVEPLLRRDGDEYFENFAKAFYDGYTSALSTEQLVDYADKQCYMASMNLMNAASVLGIDSCPVGGFEADKVLRRFAIDPDRYAVSLLVPLGYRVNPPAPKQRRAFDDVVAMLD